MYMPGPLDRSIQDHVAEHARGQATSAYKQVRSGPFLGKPRPDILLHPMLRCLARFPTDKGNVADNHHLLV